MRMMWRAAAIGGLSVIFGAEVLAAQAVTLAIPSEILGTERAVYVRLPLGYEMRTDSYPVLYLTDGEAIDRIAVPIVDSLSRAETVPEMILVGIPHPDRRSDLTPTALQSRPGSGGGAEFFRFIAEGDLRQQFTIFFTFQCFQHRRVVDLRLLARQLDDDRHDREHSSVIEFRQLQFTVDPGLPLVV